MKGKNFKSLLNGFREHFFIYLMVSVLFAGAGFFREWSFPFVTNVFNWNYWIVIPVILVSSVGLLIVVHYLKPEKINETYLWHGAIFALILFFVGSSSAMILFLNDKNRTNIEKAETTISDKLNKCRDTFNKKFELASGRCSVAVYKQNEEVLQIPKTGCSGQDCNSTLAAKRFSVKKDHETKLQSCIDNGIFGWVFDNGKEVNEPDLRNPINKGLCYKPIDDADFEQDISILCVPSDSSPHVRVGVVCVSSPKQVVFTFQDVNEMMNLADQLADPLTVLAGQYR